MSKKQNYTVQAPNATAVNLLRSWLTAAGISSRSSKSPGFDLVVTTATGADLEVQVSKTCNLLGAGTYVSAAALTGRSPSAALKAFHDLTDVAGYDRRQPINRGAGGALNEKGNTRKLHYKDEDFLVTIRHTQFRRSPNPPESRWAKYKAVIEKTSAAFFRKNFDLCVRNNLTVDDVMTYARCYVVNFCGQFEIPEEQTTSCDNERKCFEYLKQNLFLDGASSLRAMLLKKERSTLPDAETVSISLFGTVDADTEVSPDVEGEEVDYDYIAKHCELDVSSPTKRKESAASKLGELLKSLPHDQMVELLRNAASNTSFDFVTRKEAARQLRLHSQSCSCDASDVGVEEDEDLAGSDSLSTEE
jgi:hypothetical protein